MLFIIGHLEGRDVRRAQRLHERGDRTIALPGQIEGGKIRLKFDFADGLRVRGDGGLKGFAIRSADGPWTWAEGRIEGETILLWNEQVAAPAEVRYGWAQNPILSVENIAGLPLRPFRTDLNSQE